MVFFVISGFLITSLLLEEESRHGRISLSMFYLRRAFRIWPVAYAFIIAVAALCAAGAVSLPRWSFLFAATFTMNLGPGSWWLGHLWSLSVEEQFYFVWPAVFLVTRGRWRLAACLAAIALAPILRTATLLAAPAAHARLEESLPFVGDALAVGCAMALAAGSIRASASFEAIIRCRTFWVVPTLGVLMFATIHTRIAPLFYAAAGQTICDFCIAATIWRLIHVRDAVFWFLNTKPLVSVGVWSYSLYVWQQLFIVRHSAFPLHAFPVNILLAFLVAYGSHRIIENPFLRLRAVVCARLSFLRRK
jgi:peptidoglycan/LPS O-acetylase OafA/YrhL